MDLLSMVGMATKRRSDYMQQAKTLARKYKEQPNLENRMKAESLGLVKGLRDKLMKWNEYERTMLDKVLVSALAAVILGLKDKAIDQKLEKAWPIIVGDMLPPLTKFLAETKEYIDSGVLRLGDQTVDFADYDLLGAVPGAIDLDADILDGANPEEAGTQEAEQQRAQGRTWPSLAERASRYLATPTYAFFALGEYMVAQDLGYKEMRRVARDDRRTCIDCRNYGQQGWEPIGELPMPGKGCRCYDRCRCNIEYR
jgi:hypothetical protein